MRAVLPFLRLEWSILTRRRGIVLLMLASVAFGYLQIRHDAPDMSRHSISLGVAVLPLVFGFLVLSYVEGSRIRDGAMGEILESTPRGRRTPHLAQALALYGVALISQAVVVGLGIAFLAAGDPVREPDFAELGVAATSGLMTVSLGVLLVARLRLKGVVAIAVLLLGLIQLGANPDTGVLGFEGTAYELQRFAPVQPPSQFAPLDVVDRNALGHLGVMLGTAAFAWGLAFATVKHPTPMAAVAVGLAMVVMSWRTGLPAEPPGDQLVAYYGTERRCESISDIEACTYPGYEPWAARWVDAINVGALGSWHHVTGIVQLAVNESESTAARAVHQPGVLQAEMSYDRPGAPGTGMAALRLQAALGAVGLPETQVDEQGNCFAGGQARTVVALWLAGSGVDDTVVVDWLQSRAETLSGEVFWIGREPSAIMVTRGDVDLAISLLSEQDSERIEQVVSSIRSDLSSNMLTSDELARLLGATYQPTELTEDMAPPCV